MRSPTVLMRAASSSEISKPPHWSSIAIINSRKSSQSAPRSSMKCASSVTRWMSTSRCLEITVRSAMRLKPFSPALDGRTSVIDDEPRFGAYDDNRYVKESPRTYSTTGGSRLSEAPGYSPAGKSTGELGYRLAAEYGD